MIFVHVAFFVTIILSYIFLSATQIWLNVVINGSIEAFHDEELTIEMPYKVLRSYYTLILATLIVRPLYLAQNLFILYMMFTFARHQEGKFDPNTKKQVPMMMFLENQALMQEIMD